MLTLCETEVIDTVDEPLDGRLVQYLLTAPVGDGGQWDMVVNLVEKYGLVRIQSSNPTCEHVSDWQYTGS